MKPSILCWIFQETLWFFEVFEIVRTGGSPILFIYHKPRACSSLILIIKKNLELAAIRKSNGHPMLIWKD
jgi:hypothetical protein